MAIEISIDPRHESVAAEFLRRCFEAEISQYNYITARRLGIDDPTHEDREEGQTINHPLHNADDIWEE
jgi:hypothetical protein